MDIYAALIYSSWSSQRRSRSKIYFFPCVFSTYWITDLGLCILLPYDDILIFSSWDLMGKYNTKSWVSFPYALYVERRQSEKLPKQSLQPQSISDTHSTIHTHSILLYIHSSSSQFQIDAERHPKSGIRDSGLQDDNYFNIFFHIYNYTNFIH